MKTKNQKASLLFLASMVAVFLLSGSLAFAQSESATPAPAASPSATPQVGRKAAAKYFQKDVEEDGSDPAPVSNSDSLLMLHIGGFSSSTSYQWKDNTKRTGVGKATYGITYLFDQWGKLDTNLRFDFMEYKIDDTRATKMSVLPLWTFPMADRNFPLYFGFGAGLGIYFQQLEDESNISLDYQLVAGARFVDIIENFGAFVEFGMKNHLHVLSDGQFNGTALSAGAVFTF